MKANNTLFIMDVMEYAPAGLHRLLLQPGWKLQVGPCSACLLVPDDRGQLLGGGRQYHIYLGAHHSQLLAIMHSVARLRKR